MEKLSNKPNIAIIGTGLSGLVIAHKLKSHANITLYEKARGVAGRMATRYHEKFQFDHGTQFFTVHSEEFKTFLEPAIKQQVIVPWKAHFVEIDSRNIIRETEWSEQYPHYVAAPKMNALCKFLAEGFDINLQHRITGLVSDQDSKWQLINEGKKIEGKSYDWVITTIPSPQAEEILPQNFKYQDILRSVEMQGCYSLMLGFDKPIDIPWQAALVKNKDISWISVNSSKPGRPEPYTLLINSTNKWAENNIEKDKDDAISHLISELQTIISFDESLIVHQNIQRWRYANAASNNYSEPALVDHSKQLAACGDWCIKGRVEAAFTSADYCAQSILSNIS